MGRTSDRKDADDAHLGRIIVVEDDAILALSIEDTLLAAGAREVVVCATAARAVALLGAMRPDGVVLDIHLADSDEGWELAELIPLIGAPPPRIVFSTGMPDAIPERIAALGPVLTKPYDPAELVRALRANSRPGLLARIRSTLR